MAARKTISLLLRVVVGVHRLGRHVPLVPIDRLAERARLSAYSKARGPLQVARQIVGANGDGAVVPSTCPGSLSWV